MNPSGIPDLECDINPHVTDAQAWGTVEKALEKQRASSSYLAAIDAAQARHEQATALLAAHEDLSAVVVVPKIKLEALLDVATKAECIRHWHDTMFNPSTGECDGMVVSASHVRELWDALSKLHPHLP